MNKPDKHLITIDDVSAWVDIGGKLQCDTNAGEVYLDSSRGKVPTLEACRRSCAESIGCKSISYFNTRWCSHFSTPCTRVTWNKKVVMSMRAPGIPDEQVPVKRHLRGSR